MNDQQFFKTLHKAITGSEARRQKAALALRDHTFIRPISVSYPMALLIKVRNAHRTLVAQAAVVGRDEEAYEAWLEKEAERAEAINA